jgi:fibro-slime domain-containing protein
MRMSRTNTLSVVAAFALLAAACGGTPEVSRQGPKGSGGNTGDASVVDSGTGGPPLFTDAGPCTGKRCVDAGGHGGATDSGPSGYCGDGKFDPTSEACDDGNTIAGDGCSQTCEREANYSCPTPGKPCVSTVVCGDSKITGTEQCDDGHALAGDGCDDHCQLEPGWSCPYVGLGCVAAKCGDSIVAGIEECDDGNAVPNDGCDAGCRLEAGFKCDVPGAKCTATICGDGKREGTEQCDDGNFDLGDGCTPLCGLEPRCDQGPCVSACGDGIVLGNEACDDGNTRDGDGCSSSCVVETGFSCKQPPLPPQLDIPLVVRDMNAVDPLPAVNAGPPQDYASPNHVDFELVGSEPSGLEDGVAGAARIVRSGKGSAATTGRGLDLGQPGETLAIQNLDRSTIATVSLAGKPVYALTRAQCDKTALPVDPSWDKCTKTTMDLDSFASWYVDHDTAGKTVTWPNFLARNKTVLKTLTLLRGSFDAAGVFSAGGTGYTYDSRFMKIDGTRVNTDGFFPVDEFGLTGKECGGASHDFHFTSEVRFWFDYDSATTPSLDFSGDDDVWVYVNGHLALDIGGIHGRQAKSFTIDAGNAAAWGLANAKVFEIAVFQAERNQCASNYWLTLKGFNTAKSVCQSTCGDGILASNELCDDGPANQATNPPDYGRCSVDCKTRGPYCGDGHVDAGHEECDDGVNTSVYDFNGTGCAPGCVKPPRCGDGKIQSPEQCDDGTNDGSYGGCTLACTLAPRCGDGVIQTSFGETCDDGPRGSSTCSTGCRTQVPR